MILDRRSMLTGALSVSLLSVCGCVAEARAPAVGDEDDEIITTAKDDPQNFTNLLTPYGSWVEVEGYGQVFQPSSDIIGIGFTPYVSHGHWLFSDEGWVFESDLPFGWATYHYGRWAFEPSMGWFWQRGDDFAPAWVEWRQGGGYLGWAPIAPARDGVEANLNASAFTFVPEERVIERRLEPYVLSSERVSAAMSATQRVPPRSGEKFSRGPDVDRVEREAHIKVPRGSNGRDRGQDVVQTNMPHAGGSGQKSHHGGGHGKHSSSQ
jgi:hypothetical protein